MGLKFKNLLTVLFAIAVLMNVFAPGGHQAEAKCPVEKKKTCNTICTYIYSPVCAFNGTQNVIYGNQCELEAQQCLAQQTPGAYVPQPKPDEVCKIVRSNVGVGGFKTGNPTDTSVFAPGILKLRKLVRSSSTAGKSLKPLMNK